MMFFFARRTLTRVGVHVYLREEVFGRVRRVFDFSCAFLGFAVLVLEERIELCNEVGIRCDIR